MKFDDRNTNFLSIEDDTIEVKPEEINPQQAEDQNETNSTQFSAVATTPQHKKILVASIVVVTIGVIYYIFFGRTPTAQEIQDKKEADIVAKKEQLLQASTPVTPAVDSSLITPPKLSTPPQLTAPTPPEPPPPPTPVAPPAPMITQTPQSIAFPNSIRGISVDRSDSDRAKKLEAKRKAGMIVVGGGGNKDSSNSKDSKDDKDNKDSKTKKSNDEFMGFGNGTLESVSFSKTSATQVKATKMGNLDTMIAQGKMINALLETAINTDLPGDLRAIITRDVYAESGKNILIPKGSRVIGSYKSDVVDGQSRVGILWTRLMRPDGIDLDLQSNGTDQLGRSGVQGVLDTKFWTKIASAFLISYIIPIATNKISNVNTKDTVTNSTTTSPTGTSNVSTSSVAAQQSAVAAQKFGDVAEKAINNTFPTKPTITINQGTRVNIFVQRDLIFPSSFNASQMGIIR